MSYLSDDFDDRGDESSINDSLDLCGVSSSDVGYRPGGLFLDAVLGVLEEIMEDWESSRVKDGLGLRIVSCDNVPHCSQGRGDHTRLLVAKELN